MAMVAWWLGCNLQLQSDLSLFLPQGHSSSQRLLLSELRQGEASRLLLLGISGGSAEGRADLSQGLVGALRGSGFFERVENGAPGELELDAQLMRYRYLLEAPDRLQKDLDTAGLRSALMSRLAELNSPLPSPFKSLIPRDPTGVYSGLLKRWRTHNRVTRTAGVWSSQDGDRALLLALTREGGLAMERQSRILALIRDQFKRLDPGGDYHLTLSGPGSFSVLSKQLIETESRRLSLFATAVVALLLLLAYRYPPYLLYAALPLLSGLLVASSVTLLWFGKLHGITLAFGITLLGVTLDYPVHLFSHLDPSEPSGKTMRRIWPTLRLGVITTCLGFSVLVLTDFAGLRQIGIFTLAGLLSAALVSRYLLPRLLPPSAARRPSKRNLLGKLNKKRWLPIGLVAVLTLAAALGLSCDRTLWNDDVAVLSPVPPSLLAQDRELRHQLLVQQSNQLLLLQGEDMDQLLHRCESLKQLLALAVAEGLLSGATLPCDYLPDRQAQLANQRLIPPPGEMARRLAEALDGLPFRDGAFNDFLEELQASRQLTPLRYEDLQPGLLREGLDPLLRSQQDGYLALVPIREVKPGDELPKLLQQAPPGVQLLNLRLETSRLIGGFRQEILQRMALGILVMLAVLWFGLRSLLRAFGILAPIAAAILITLALQLWREEAMNLFHLISLMLVLGIGIDFSLFFSRERFMAGGSDQTLHALTLCALSTVSVFAILGSSAIAVLHAIGSTVAIGVSLSFFATYAFWHIPWEPSGRRLA
jgi:predicted exporter